MIHHTELLELLDYYPTLRVLPPRLYQALQQDGQRLKVSAGQMLFDVGSPCQAFIMLTSGSVRVTVSDNDGHEVLLYRLQPGETCLLSVSCLLGHSNYPARAVVETDLSGFSIHESLFIELMELSLDFRTFIFRLLAERLAHLMQVIQTLAFQGLEQRLANLLLAKGASIKVTHQMLADELGTAREVISRALEKFEEQGLLKLGRGRIYIKDKVVLEKVALLSRNS